MAMRSRVISSAIMSAMLIAGVVTPVAAPTPAQAISALQLPGGGGDFILKTRRNWYDNKFSRVLKQQYDFSCGSAALASLLHFYYDRPVAEKEVLEAMFANGDQEKIKKEGFSLLDMKNYLATHGLEANGYRDPLDKLTQVGIPAIALINTGGYKHFVVVQAVSEDKVLIGDPALGMKLKRRKQFDQMWNGILFVVTNEMDTARKSLAGDERWKAFPRARFDNQIIEKDLAGFLIQLPQTPGYF